MNNDLISRSELKKAIENYLEKRQDVIIWETDMLNMLDNAPTVEVEFELKTENGITYPKALEHMTFTHTLSIEERQNIIEAYMLGANSNIRPQGEWIITAEDNEGIHRIQCPFCRYEKGSDFIDYITVTFEKLPPFCENCGAELKGSAEE